MGLDCTSGQVQPGLTQPNPENWVGSGWSSQPNGLGWVQIRLLIGSVWFGFWVPSVHRLANLGSVQVLTFQTEPCFRVGSGFCQETDLAIYRHHVIISACKFT